ncbi:MAG TPA: hypothetical protein VH475_05405 [Tepidisphaeraceae bacterium]|jgi:predicted Zn-ribbon and HTH transcriptional regulator
MDDVFPLALVAWLVLTAATGVAIDLLLRRRNRRRQRTIDPLPTCAQCGYIAFALPIGRRCPECGSDLRISGIDR